MAWLDHIRECNAHDPTRYLPLRCGGIVIGALRKDRVPRVLDLCDALHPDADGLVLRTEPDTPTARTAAIDALCDELFALGDLPYRHGERYPAVTSFGDAPLFALDRGAVAFFGVRAFGVHLNAYVSAPSGMWMWLAQRSRTKPSFPGMLDNLVAGGQPLGISLLDNLVKECAEEAAIPKALARTARACGSISYVMETERGLKPDEMFCFDLELPADFRPRNTDGEVEAFSLLPIDDVKALVRDTRRIKPNCNLVILDFLLRRGLLGEPEAVCEGVRRGLRLG